MTDKEYQQKKHECWKEIWAPYREEVFMSDYGNDILVIADKVFKTAFDRAYALGKQEKDAENTVIQGWVARDKSQFLGLYPWQPKRGNIAWECGSCMVLPINTFPDLTWESEPLEVEIVIKRKKK